MWGVLTLVTRLWVPPENGFFLVQFFGRFDRIFEPYTKSVTAVSVISPPKHQERAVAISETAPPPQMMMKICLL